MSENIIKWENEVQKQVFRNDHNFEMVMPKAARIVGVGIDGDLPFMWVVIDKAFLANLETKKFKIYHTNTTIKNDSQNSQWYTGTFKDPQGLDCHVFEVFRRNVKKGETKS